MNTNRMLELSGLPKKQQSSKERWESLVAQKHGRVDYFTVDELSEKFEGQAIVAVVGFFYPETETGRVG